VKGSTESVSRQAATNFEIQDRPSVMFCCVLNQAADDGRARPPSAVLQDRGQRRPAERVALNGANRGEFSCVPADGRRNGTDCGGGTKPCECHGAGDISVGIERLRDQESKRLDDRPAHERTSLS
jgi:hypothetical protein